MKGSSAGRRSALRARLREQRGQTATEYLGMIVVVAAIISGLALGAPAIAALIERGVREALCPLTEKACDPGLSDAGNPLDPNGTLPPGQVVPPGGGVHGVDPTTTQADPVNSLTGAFETEVTDARLPGPGEPFELLRSYSSENADEEGPLGPGWTHAYATRLEILANAIVELHAGDGQVVRYSRQGDEYLAHPSIRSELRADGSGYELETREQLRYRFDSEGRLQSIVDRNDNATSLSYDDGRLAEVTDTAGREIAFANDGERLSEVRLPDGRKVAYDYDDDGRLAEVTDLRGGTTRYGYDGEGRLRSITDQLGVRMIENTYSDGGRVVKQVDARGATTEFDWDEEERTQTMTDARGEKWRDSYDEVGRLVSQSDPLGNSVTYEWDGAFRVVAIVDPRNYRWELDYDENHNLTRIAAPEPLGYTESYDYNAFNEPTSYTDPAGNTWRLGYDERGNLAESVAPDGATTRIGVDGRGLPVSVSDPLGRTTTTDYDAEGNATRVTNPAGDSTYFAYDEAGRPISATDPRAPRPGAPRFSWRLAWNGSDQLTETVDPLGNATRIAYDAAGRQVAATDAKGRTARWLYDGQGNLLAVRPPGGAPTVYTYDPTNRVSAITDPEGNRTGYLRNAAGQVNAAIGPSREVATALYDRAGNLVQVTDPNGNASGASGDGTTRLDYDPIGRPTAIDFSDDDTPDIAIGWDPRSLPTSIRDGQGTERRSFDSVGRLTRVARSGDAFRYAYDVAGQLTERLYPDDTAQRYSYDAAGRLASAAGPAGTLGYSYDRAGNLTRSAYPNGVLETRAYDAASRLTEITARAGRKLIARSAYTLDPTANPTLVETESGAVSYAYDERDRLVEACYAESCEAAGEERESFAYDEIGNLTERSGPEGTTGFDYDDSSRLTAVSTPDGTLDYAHDANGNVTSAGERSFEFDQLNRIVRASTPEGETTYAYQAFLRASADGPGGEVSYAWDKAFALPQLATASGPQGRTSYSYGNGRTAQQGPGATLFFHPDALGSTRALTTAKGDLADRISYRPYGEQREGESEPPTRQRFTGELQEPDTGLYYLRARDYDATSGRFLQPDPLIAGVGEPWRSPFAYVEGRPTTTTDPSGMDPFDPLALDGQDPDGGLGGVLGSQPGGPLPAFLQNGLPTGSAGGFATNGAFPGSLLGANPGKPAGLLASASTAPDPLKSGEVEISVGPFSLSRGENTDDDEQFGGFDLEFPVPFPGEQGGDGNGFSRVVPFGVHGTVNTGEVDSEDDSLGALFCAGWCIGADTDFGFTTGAGLDFDVNIPDEVPILGGL